MARCSSRNSSKTPCHAMTESPGSTSGVGNGNFASARNEGAKRVSQPIGATRAQGPHQLPDLRAALRAHGRLWKTTGPCISARIRRIRCRGGTSASRAERPLSSSNIRGALWLRCAGSANATWRPPTRRHSPRLATRCAESLDRGGPDAVGCYYGNPAGFNPSALTGADAVDPGCWVAPASSTGARSTPTPRQSSTARCTA